MGQFYKVSLKCMQQQIGNNPQYIYILILIKIENLQ